MRAVINLLFMLLVIFPKALRPVCAVRLEIKKVVNAQHYRNARV